MKNTQLEIQIRNQILKKNLRNLVKLSKKKYGIKIHDNFHHSTKSAFISLMQVTLEFIEIQELQ